MRCRARPRSTSLAAPSSSNTPRTPRHKAARPPRTGPSASDLLSGMLAAGRARGIAWLTACVRASHRRQMGEPADGLGVDCRPDEGPEDAIRLCRGGSRLLREPRYVLLVRSLVCVCSKLTCVACCTQVSRTRWSTRHSTSRRRPTRTTATTSSTLPRTSWTRSKRREAPSAGPLPLLAARVCTRVCSRSRSMVDERFTGGMTAPEPYPVCTPYTPLLLLWLAAGSLARCWFAAGSAQGYRAELQALAHQQGSTKRTVAQ